MYYLAFSSRSASGRWIMRPVIAALNKNRPAEAARLFVGCVLHKTVPQGPGLMRWLVRAIGRADTRRLTQALAQQHCFYCTKGIESCEQCNGRGYFDDSTICRTCSGLGVARCDFCAGSGYVTYKYIPEGLRMAAISERSRGAVAEIHSLLKEPIPLVTDRRLAASRRALMLLLAKLNRLMGVLENAIDESESMVPIHPAYADPADRVIRACMRAAAKLDPRIRQVLMNLADVAQCEAAATSKPSVRKILEQRARFYRSLGSSGDFTGTSLRRPFLKARRQERSLRDRSSPAKTPPKRSRTSRQPSPRTATPTSLVSPG